MKITKHSCRVKSKCKECVASKMHITSTLAKWRNGHHTLKYQFKATKPGLIQGVKYKRKMIGESNYRKLYRLLGPGSSGARVKEKLG